MRFFRKFVKPALLLAPFIGGIVLSLSSCSDDSDENLPLCIDYRDSLRCIFQQNAFVGTYQCTDACNIAPAFQDYQIIIKPHPDGCPKLLISNFAALNEFTNPFNGFEIDAELILNSTLDSTEVQSFNMPQSTYYSNNNQDTLLISSEGSLFSGDTLVLQYRYRINSNTPEIVCITNAIRVDP